MTVKGGTSPACAACKYQRRKCSSECVLAPYFPANQPKMFQNAHRLFGVCNIMKILRQLDDNDQKADAMKSIIFEADMWEKFPVYGCVEYICHLRQQLELALEELRYVYAQLAIYREQHQHLASTNSTTGPFFTSDGEFSEGGPKTLLGTSGSLFDMKINNHVVNTNYDQQINSLAFPTSNQRDISQDYECLINPFNNIMADDRQSYVETKEACDSSSESSKSLENLSQNELRNAAACFSLTSNTVTL
ncbi:LOB domain-containing protein 4-like [Lycium ferocissimum]|uniref:LOB domain-containing protein 4-like n=1 Tax=Lycium ferocissimum TaxID=112874 RepID=UPI002814A31B|nr:LOB domain-containing protein 4-like [Lycium ferocissimum]